MAEGVVDFLEAVEIDEKERERPGEPVVLVEPVELGEEHVEHEKRQRRLPSPVSSSVSD